MNQFMLKDWKEGKYSIPKELKGKKGIYYIKLPNSIEAETLKFIDHIPGHKDDEKSKPYDVNRLKDKINKTINEKQRFLYIGKAGGKNQKSDLYKRLSQYMKYLFGKGNIHRGGRAIAQIKNFESFICEYEILEDSKEPERVESEKLKCIKDKYKEFPLANWRL